MLVKKEKIKKEYQSEDGFVYVFEIPNEYVKYYDSDTVSVISNIARRPYNTNSGMDLTSLTNSERKDIDAFNDNLRIKRLLHEIQDEKPYFKPEILLEHLSEILCVKPLMKNRRIIRQDGAFLLFGIGKKKTEPSKVSEEWVKKIIRVNKNKKSDIMKDLVLMGVSKDKVYPELEQVGEYLKEKYLKTNNKTDAKNE